MMWLFHLLYVSLYVLCSNPCFICFHFLVEAELEQLAWQLDGTTVCTLFTPEQNVNLKLQ